MVNLAAPKPVRFLVMLSAAFLLVSMMISGVNAYVALASGLQAPYVSDKVGFEGQLTDSQGAPVTDGNYAITFSLYSAATGGSALWTETQTVAVNDGLYSVQLGANTALSSTAFDGARWLGVKVGSDSEMTPRITISAVPFALNARQAQGLQGFNVSSNSPATNDALYWTGSQWAPRAGTFTDLGPVTNNASPQNFLANYRSGSILSWVNANTVKVSAGEVMVNGFMRRNTSDVNVGFTSGGLNLGLDTGTAVNNTTYYIYAVADNTSMSTFELIISANSSTPTGKTNYRKLGWFKTMASSTSIEPGSAGNVAVNDVTFVPSVRVYNTSAISISSISTPVTLTFNSERFDTDSLHNTTNTSRLTANIAGKYLIFGQGKLATSGGRQLTLTIKLNGSTLIAESNTDENNAKGGMVATVYDLAAGDYVELTAEVNAGTPVNIAASGNYSPEFGMIWLGP